MNKKRVILFLIILLPFFTIAQTGIIKSPTELRTDINHSRPDTNRIKLLLSLGSYYLFKQGSYKTDIDSALICFNQALALSKTLKFPRWQIESLKLKGDCYLEANNFINGKACFKSVIDFYHLRGDLKDEALTWSRLGDCVDNSTKFTDEKISFYRNAGSIFSHLHDRFNQLQMQKNVADVHLNQGKLSLAQSELLNVLTGLKQIHYHKLHDTYFLLSGVSRLEGDFNKELFYCIETVKSMELSADTANSTFFYYRLAQAYDHVGMLDESQSFFAKTLSISRRRHDYGMVYYAAVQIAKVLINENKAPEALSILQQTIRKDPPINYFNKYLASMGLANCYRALRQYKKAEMFYLKMLMLTEIIYKNRDLVFEDYVKNYVLVSSYYIDVRQYNKASFYLEKLLTLPKGKVIPIYLGQLQLMQFEVDSAQGKYLAAIVHYQAHKKINDSLFNVTKGVQAQELQVSYETEKKDKNILILKKQAQLNRSQFQHAKVVRNLMFLGSGMLCLLLGLVYSRYRIKRHKNAELEVKQKEISSKNAALERLLRDNEWLLREVHHRVKNNLQIVMSLLSSQSAYLKDEVALNAMKESQHRVQAMALIHQKLYKSSNISSIYMPDYINDLLAYLKESFKTKQSVYFEKQIEPIKLDILQAIPVGLVLNEIITNALKHAFPHTREDRIIVKFFTSAGDEVTLTVIDNGLGLPSGFDLDRNGSFGITLMKGLIDDLEGTLTFDGSDGTSVSMTFKKDNIL